MGTDSGFEYPSQTKIAFGKKVRERLTEKGFKKLTDFVEFSGLPDHAVRRLTRGISDGSSFATVVQMLLALDMDIYEMVELLNLDETVKQRMKEDKEYFQTLKWMDEK